MLPLTALAAVLCSTLALAAKPGLSTQSKAMPRCWVGTNFPSKNDWVPFDMSFNIQKNNMLFNGDSLDEIESIHSAIQSWSSTGGVDPRLILAVIMRESSGRVDTSCGDQGKSCGIMQVQGDKIFQNANHCTKHPCARDQITYMVKCGTVGGCEAQTGSNIRSCLGANGGNPAAAMRCYNTGSVTNKNDYTVAKYGIRSYVSDIANILLGAEVGTWTKLEQQCFPNNQPCGNKC